MPTRISFIRHGRPAAKGWYAPDKIIRGSHVAQMLLDYAQTGLDRTLPPPVLAQCVDVNGLTLCSDLPRAIESARWFGFCPEPIENPLFREADLPSGYFQGLRLKAWQWMALSRALWLVGFHRNAESFAIASKRAAKGCAFIMGCAAEGQSVNVFAHGIINLLMIKHLLARGWRLKNGVRVGYWGCTTMVKSGNE
jgi:hypothetical protein